MNNTQKHRKITVSGDLGSGKSTICYLLNEALGYKIYSTGQLLRELAQKYNMSIYELNKYAETHPEIDREIDDTVKKFSFVDENFVFDSRMAWNFIENSFKIHFITNLDVAAARIYNANRDTEKYGDINETKEMLIKRKLSENKRYKEIYAVDTSDLNNYDLVIDTSNSTPEEIKELILDKLAYWEKGEEFQKLWVSPKLLYPTKSITKLNIDLVDELTNSIESTLENRPIEVVLIDNFFFIINGHARTSATLFNDLSFVSIKLLAQDNEELESNVSALEYVKNNCKKSYIYDWEEGHHFSYKLIPEFI